jgi:endonuclease YncB( thermonuclease family)
MVSGWEKAPGYGSKEPSNLEMIIGMGAVYGIPLALCVYALGNWAFASPASSAPYSVEEIYWSDGDSGRIDGHDFRLANIDAPETNGVGAAIGGAKCERERKLGYQAKEYVVKLTRNADLMVTREVGEDRYGRMVLELSADGKDIGSAGVAAGHLKPWPHDGSRALSDKPDWCQ